MHADGDLRLKRGCSVVVTGYFPVLPTLSFSFQTLLNTGSTNEANGLIFKEMLQTPNFRITVVQESDIVELCGALKVMTSTHYES